MNRNEHNHQLNKHNINIVIGKGKLTYSLLLI